MCPAGHEAVSEYEDALPTSGDALRSGGVCEPCSLRPRCPCEPAGVVALSSGESGPPSGAYVLSADLARVNTGRRRRAESDGQWRKRYACGDRGYELRVETVVLAAYEYVEVRGSGSPSTSRPWRVTSRMVRATRCWSHRLPWRPLPPLHATEPLPSPLMPPGRGMAHHNYLRPQHKPQPEQPGHPSRLTALTRTNPKGPWHYEGSHLLSWILVDSCSPTVSGHLWPRRHRCILGLVVLVSLASCYPPSIVWAKSSAVCFCQPESE